MKLVEKVIVLESNFLYQKEDISCKRIMKMGFIVDLNVIQVLMELYLTQV